MGVLAGNLHICENNINAEHILEQHVSSRDPFQRHPCFFQQNTKPHFACVTTAWLSNQRVRVLDWPACNPDLLDIKNVHLLKLQIQQQRPFMVAQLILCVTEKWKNIPLLKLDQSFFSAPQKYILSY